MIRIVPTRAEEIVEVRIAVVGNVDSGKSTLTGVLTRGGLDDGRGKVSGFRVQLFSVRVESLLRFGMFVDSSRSL